MALIEVERLSKQFRVLNRREGLGGAFRDLFSRDYRTVDAVLDVSFAIEPGEVVGYIGPNGAGKSTTIKMMTGMLRPSGGSVLVDGEVPFSNRIRQARIMGVVFGQRTQLWWDLPVIESFRVLKDIYHVSDADFDAHIARFDDLVGLGALHAQQARTLSLGQRMLCDIAASFLHDPKVVFLDEPTIGLDGSVKAKIRSLVAELNAVRDTTIILTTHDLGDIEALCERTIIIDRGSVLFDGPTQQVTTMFGAFRTVRFQIDGFASEDAVGLLVELADRFGADAELAVQCAEAGWADVTLDQQRTPLSGVLAFVMERRQVHDVRIVEIEMEHVVQRVYEGALAAGRPM